MNSKEFWDGFILGKILAESEARHLSKKALKKKIRKQEFNYDLVVEPNYLESLKKWSYTRDYSPPFSLHVLLDAKNIVVKGTALEKNLPPRKFDFYILDESNLDLWKEGASFKAYYLGVGASSYSFTLFFRKKEDLPESIYFVAEVPKDELNPNLSSEELKREVKVSAIVSCVKV
jgi:hypothetical protein